jgi:hypothetical protein
VQKKKYGSAKRFFEKIKKAVHNSMRTAQFTAFSVKIKNEGSRLLPLV